MSEHNFNEFINCNPRNIGKRGSLPYIMYDKQNQVFEWLQSDSYENWKKLKDPQYADYRITYNVNSHGFRGPEIDLNNDRKKILCVGDSFTYGLGLKDEHMWVNILQNKLGPDYQVVNISENGCSNEKIARMAMQTIEMVDPVVVIALMTVRERRGMIRQIGKEVFDANILRNCKYVEPAEKKFYKAYFSTQDDMADFFNFIQSLQFLEMMTKANNCAFGWASWEYHTRIIDKDVYRDYLNLDHIMPHMEDLDRARDGGHFGPVSNEAFANTTYEFIKDYL